MNFLSMIKNKLGALSISLGIFAVVTTINSQTIQLTLWDRPIEETIFDTINFFQKRGLVK